MYLSDIHTHSIASGHGTICTISDMAKAASKKGLKLLGITDHGPGTLAAGTSSYFRSLTYAPKKRFGIELLFGVELNILDIDGHLDLNEHCGDARQRGEQRRQHHFSQGKFLFHLFFPLAFLE